MADNPQTEVEIINDVGAPLPTSIIGASDGTPIGNIGDAIKFIPQSQSLRTYTASITNLTIANAATDVFTISGATDKIIKIRAFTFSATKQNSGLVDVLGIKRSSDNTGGTSTTLTKASHDSLNAAGAATVKAYTANPTTLGTEVGVIFTQKFFVPSANNSSAGQISSINLGSEDAQPITLNSAAEIFALNLNAQTLSGNSFDIYITWTEEDT